MTFCLWIPKEESRNCPGLDSWDFCEFITLCSNLGLKWGLKQTCSSRWNISNGVSHSICTHQGWVDSQLLVVGSQIGNLTPNPFFCHNLCCKCSNGSCKAIFDIYTSIAFQWQEKRLKARCFDPCNWTLKFRESQRTPKSPFRECECHPHTFPKVGLWHIGSPMTTLLRLHLS